MANMPVPQPLTRTEFLAHHANSVDCYLIEVLPYTEYVLVLPWRPSSDRLYYMLPRLQPNEIDWSSLAVLCATYLVHTDVVVRIKDKWAGKVTEMWTFLCQYRKSDATWRYETL